MLTALVVDDAKFMRQVVKGILEKNNYEVIGEADNGLEAIQMYINRRPDIVTMDISMPNMDGIEATKHIINYDANAIIIICSVVGQQKYVARALKYGAKDFIIKPIKENRMAATIKKIEESMITKTKEK